MKIKKDNSGFSYDKSICTRKEKQKDRQLQHHSRYRYECAAKKW